VKADAVQRALEIGSQRMLWGGIDEDQMVTLPHGECADFIALIL
jgi:hypothetical protein